MVHTQYLQLANNNLFEILRGIAAAADDDERNQ